jgi:hypothetical protein
MSADIYTLGAARVIDDNGKPIPPVCHVTLEVDKESGIREDQGEVPLAFALGLTSLPAPPDDNGQADGVAIDGVGGFTSCVVGGRDTRCSDVTGKLKGGETCLHNTGGDASKRSRVLLKEDCAAIIVGNDVVQMLDRKNKKVTIAAFGHIYEMSTEQGITMMTKGGKSCIHLMEDGTIDIICSTLNIGGASAPATPATSVLCGVSGLTGVPASTVGAGVYIRP